ncbi:MAG: SufD family Fe-S cluster assembly protein [Gammaproteobacteria bacterium]|nr:SufD family Fe-S cluster assembly protein [Gammaproteobacteria bacterium]
MAVGVEALQDLEAPPWLDAEGFRRCRQALDGKLARETWKYSPLPKVANALIRADAHRQPPAVALPPEAALHRLDESDAPPLEIDLNRYPLAGIAAARAGAGWLIDVKRTPSHPLRIPAPAPGAVAAPLLVRVAPGCRVELEQEALPRNDGSPMPQPKRGGVAAMPSPAGLRAQVLVLSLAADSEAHWAAAQFTPDVEEWSLLQAHLQRNAALTLNQQCAVGGFLRQDVNVVLGGQGARLASVGAALVRDGGRLDQQLVVEHASRGTVSRIKQHNLAAGRSRCTFNGRIHIHVGAAGADADLSNRNLALDPSAEVNTKPELEIYNDDVRCAHGATVGQLDAEALFYLLSRGLETWQAQRLLSLGFLRDGLAGPFAEPAAEAFAAHFASA